MGNPVRPPGKLTKLGRIRMARKQRRAVIEAVARHVAAMCKPDRVPPRIAVEAMRVTHRTAGQPELPKPRLRLDRVALRLVQRLHDALHEALPPGKVVLLTISAPIRMPSKTAAEMEARIRSYLSRRRVPADAKYAIHGNTVRVRLASDDSKRAAKVIGLVHNPDSDPYVLLDIARSLLECIGVAAARRLPPTFLGQQWLVLVNEGGPPLLKTYRDVYSQLHLPNHYKKILMLFPNGRVETLAG